MTKLLEYLPEFYREIHDFVELVEAEASELEQVRAEAELLLSNQFVTTADETSIRRRELQIGIRADTSTETLEFRKRRLINRYSTKPPFTIHYLQQRLDALVGAGRAVVSIDVQNFLLTVTVNIPSTPYFREIEYTINTVKPANLSYNQATEINTAVSLEEHIWRIALTRPTRLGSWTIGLMPFAEQHSEVQIK